MYSFVLDLAMLPIDSLWELCHEWLGLRQSRGNRLLHYWLSVSESASRAELGISTSAMFAAPQSDFGLPPRSWISPSCWNSDGSLLIPLWGIINWVQNVSWLFPGYDVVYVCLFCLGDSVNCWRNSVIPRAWFRQVIAVIFVITFTYCTWKLSVAWCWQILIAYIITLMLIHIIQHYALFTSCC